MLRKPHRQAAGKSAPKTGFVSSDWTFQEQREASTNEVEKNVDAHGHERPFPRGRQPDPQQPRLARKDAAEPQDRFATHPSVTSW
jgi:hypothetical protein